MKLRRQPRKKMRVKAAAELLQCSPGTVKNLIYRDQLLDAISRRPGTTSPLELYESQVRKLAAEWGIL